MNKPKRPCGTGTLPENAPLANPYVPFQIDDPPQYPANKAIIRGTLFHGLELPFHGLVNQQELPINGATELQTLAFALQELSLYLDTHREDAEALERYRSCQRLYHDALMAYNADRRPLTHILPAEGPYRWLDDPWPWEYCANVREVK